MYVSASILACMLWRHPDSIPLPLQVPFEDFQNYPRNEVTLMGNLGSDMQLRTTTTGKDVANVNLGVNSGPKGGEQATMW